MQKALLEQFAGLYFAVKKLAAFAAVVQLAAAADVGKQLLQFPDRKNRNAAVRQHNSAEGHCYKRYNAVAGVRCCNHCCMAVVVHCRNHCCTVAAVHSRNHCCTVAAVRSHNHCCTVAAMRSHNRCYMAAAVRSHSRCYTAAAVRSHNHCYTAVAMHFHNHYCMTAGMHCHNCCYRAVPDRMPLPVPVSSAFHVIPVFLCDMGFDPDIPSVPHLIAGYPADR